MRNFVLGFILLGGVVFASTDQYEVTVQSVQGEARTNIAKKYTLSGGQNWNLNARLLFFEVGTGETRYSSTDPANLYINASQFLFISRGVGVECLYGNKIKAGVFSDFVFENSSIYHFNLARLGLTGEFWPMNFFCIGPVASYSQLTNRVRDRFDTGVETYEKIDGFSFGVKAGFKFNENTWTTVLDASLFTLSVLLYGVGLLAGP